MPAGSSSEQVPPQRSKGVKKPKKSKIFPKIPGEPNLLPCRTSHSQGPGLWSFVFLLSTARKLLQKGTNIELFCQFLELNSNRDTFSSSTHKVLLFFCYKHALSRISGRDLEGIKLPKDILQLPLKLSLSLYSLSSKL